MSVPWYQSYAPLSELHTGAPFKALRLTTQSNKCLEAFEQRLDSVVAFPSVVEQY